MAEIQVHAPTPGWRLPVALICGLIAVVPGIVLFGMVPALPGIILSKLELDRLRASGDSSVKVKLAMTALVMSTAGGVASVLLIALGFFAGGLRLLSR